MTDSTAAKRSRAPRLYALLATLLDRLDTNLRETEVIYRCSPVLSFGDSEKSQVATVGINPSYREFLDPEGDELQGQERRLHTLASLGIDSWDKADFRHLALIAETGRSYFDSNPYSAWFNRMEYVMAGLNASYYGSPGTACHIDLVPFAPPGGGPRFLHIDNLTCWTFPKTLSALSCGILPYRPSFSMELRSLGDSNIWLTVISVRRQFLPGF